MTFVSPLVGFVAVDVCKATSSSAPVPPAPCRGRIERTVDAGKHWTTVLQTAAPVIALTSLGRTIWAVEARTSADSARATSNWVRVLHSTNEGQGWRQLGLVRPRSELPIPSDIATQIVFASANFGAITLFSPSTCAMHGCGLDEVLTTADGGKVWSSATLPGTFFGCGTPIGAVAAAPHAKILVNLGTEGAVSGRTRPCRRNGRRWSHLAPAPDRRLRCNAHLYGHPVRQVLGSELHSGVTHRRRRPRLDTADSEKPTVDVQIPSTCRLVLI
jgi:hypothetical protein